MQNRMFNDREVLRISFKIGYSTGSTKIGRMTNSKIIKAHDRERAQEIFNSNPPNDYSGIILQVKRLD